VKYNPDYEIVTEFAESPGKERESRIFNRLFDSLPVPGDYR
jgi:hypothetical protein